MNTSTLTAPDLEQLVLATLLSFPGSYRLWEDRLTPDLFTSNETSQLYTLIHQLGTQQMDPLYDTVLHHLLANQPLARSLDISRITQLPMLVNPLNGYTYYASQMAQWIEILQQLATRRQLMAATSDFQQHLLAADSDIQAQQFTYEQQLLSLHRIQHGSQPRTLGEIANDAVQIIQQAADNKTPLTGVPTGFYLFDRLTAGLQPGELIIIAARPAVGKTALSLCMAAHMAIQKQIPVLYFTLEMTDVQVTNRILSAYGRLPAQLIKTGQLSEEQQAQLQHLQAQLQSTPLYIDKCARRPSEIATVARGMVKEHQVACIFVDYLQLMQADERKERREQEVAACSKAMKNLAVELNIPVVTLCQLNREVEHRVSKEPQLSDLRESGAIEQDADIVAFIQRDMDTAHDEDSAEINALNAGMARLLVRKHRNGMCDDIHLRFVGKYTLFTNPIPKNQNENQNQNVNTNPTQVLELWQE